MIKTVHDEEKTLHRDGKRERGHRGKKRKYDEEKGRRMRTKRKQPSKGRE